jgi:hypothetical protein
MMILTVNVNQHQNGENKLEAKNEFGTKRVGWMSDAVSVLRRADHVRVLSEKKTGKRNAINAMHMATHPTMSAITRPTETRRRAGCQLTSP